MAGEGRITNLLDLWYLLQNQSLTISQLLNKLEDLDIGIEQFFELEKIATFKLTR